jgi:hypothetical protein
VAVIVFITSESVAPSEFVGKIDLRVSVDLCASVVKILWNRFTTETQRFFTEAQRRTFSGQTLRGLIGYGGLNPRLAKPRLALNSDRCSAAG